MHNKQERERANGHPEMMPLWHIMKLYSAHGA